MNPYGTDKSLNSTPSSPCCRIRRRPMTRIFISYRRAGEIGFIARLDDWL